jgi:hypothetical protein
LADDDFESSGGAFDGHLARHLRLAAIERDRRDAAFDG